MELIRPRGVDGTITMKMMSSTRRTSMSGVTFMSEDCDEKFAEKDMEHLYRRGERWVQARWTAGEAADGLSIDTGKAVFEPLM
jgi:hypothetical protein